MHIFKSFTGLKAEPDIHTHLQAFSMCLIIIMNIEWYMVKWNVVQIFSPHDNVTLYSM